MARVGDRIKDPSLGVEVVVTKGGDSDVRIISGDSPLKVGKRYECPEIGVQVLVIKPGLGELWCGDFVMLQKEPKKTKSAD